MPRSLSSWFFANLFSSGDERFEEAIAYITKYDLHSKALALWANEPEKVKVSYGSRFPLVAWITQFALQAIYDIYGDYLFDRREYYDAALAYLLGDKPRRAMTAYEKAHAWRELFALASKQKIESSELEDICDRVSGKLRLCFSSASWLICQFSLLAEYLSSHSRHLEAAQIALDYQQSVGQAVHILCRGSQFGEAFRLVSLFTLT